MALQGLNAELEAVQVQVPQDLLNTLKRVEANVDAPEPELQEALSLAVQTLKDLYVPVFGWESV